MAKKNYKLKSLRMLKDLSQLDVANKLEIGISAYQNKENGISLFNTEEINILLELFNEKYENVFM